MNHILHLTSLESTRQQSTLNLIASENYPSHKVLQLLGSQWLNKYGEGYPGKRYYAGNIHTDELEIFVQQKALEVFDSTGEYGVNLQVLSGSPANTMVYLSVLNPGDAVMSLSLANGGHLSHLHDTSPLTKWFKHIEYDVKEIESGCFEIDIDDYTKKLKTYKPKLVILGFSAYPRVYQFEQFCKLAHEHGALVLADIAHINGLVAAGLHDSPFKSGVSGADFVSMTTHKTLRGPRGAMVFAKKQFMDSLNKTIFPGTSGGPHFHQIAAVGQCLLEILGEDSYPDNRSFLEYSTSVLESCKLLENSLRIRGLDVVSPTQTHLSLIKLPEYLDSLQVQKNLEQIGIITNRNMIPFDTKSPWRPSGLRLGTAALQSRRIADGQIVELSNIIADCVFESKSPDVLAKQVKDISQNLSWWY
jgi:glycine hydroxymethyltransferase